MFKVKMLDYEELPDDVRKGWGLPNNGSGREYAKYVVIYHNDVVIGVYSDAMEPEDATFYRDLCWIFVELERAYQIGRADMENEMIKKAMED